MTSSTKLKWAPNYQQDIDKINTKLKHYYDFYNRMVPDYESEPGLLGISFGGFGIATSIKEGSDYVAKFIINHPNLPNDKIPYWDFNDPKIPNTYKDASAGAIMASAFLELSQFVNKKQAKEYIDIATTQLKSLTSEYYLAEIGSNGNFILKHSVGNLPSKSEIDVPLTYADYYYIEAILRYQRYLRKTII